MTLSELENILKDHQVELHTFGVRRLYVVGSVARGEARPGSDVDFVVELERYTLRDFVGLKLALEDWLGVAVDLTTLRSLKPQLRKDLEGDLRRVA
ncbi:nucleotidyltransferase family protein [Meiothermus cerbereus]|uniref:nucleotidyltransferase family protein n=1 Tax=Meiothermus cerbereus TaxID=65552 RepID=UPI003EF02EEE